MVFFGLLHFSPFSRGSVVANLALTTIHRGNTSIAYAQTITTFYRQAVLTGNSAFGNLTIDPNTVGSAPAVGECSPFSTERTGCQRFLARSGTCNTMQVADPECSFISA